MNNLNK